MTIVTHTANKRLAEYRKAYQLAQSAKSSLASLLRHKGVKLTPEQFSVLSALRGADSSCLDLARDTGILVSGVSRLWPALEQKGLLTHEIREDDGRGRILFLTAAGHDLVEKVLG